MTDKRRTLSDADISSRRSSPQGLRTQSMGASGGNAARSLRRGAAHHDADGALRPETKGEAEKPGSDRD